MAASPERTCLATGAKGSPDAMIRFARSPDGVATPDLAERLPGRGAWVMADRSAIETAVRRQGFSRGFKAPTTAPEGLADMIEAALAKRCLEAVGLARKAGEAVTGFDQVRAALKEGGAAALIFASEAAEDGREKLLRLARAMPEETPLLTGCFSGGELGLALGREGAIYAALAAGPHARRFVREATRLAGFRALAPLEWASGRAPAER